MQAGANGRFSRGSPTCTTSSRISVEHSIPGSVGWKWKVDEYRHTIGCSTCKSSPRAAFDERLTRSTTKFGGVWVFQHPANVPAALLLRHVPHPLLDHSLAGVPLGWP